MLDGACDVEKLCQRVAELGMPAVAMTDHGNIFGAVHFVNAAQARRASSRSSVANSTSARKTITHRAHPARRRYLQPSAGAGGERRRLSQSGEDHVGSVSARLLLQAARQQEISGGTFQGIDRAFRMLEGRSGRASDGRQVRRGARGGAALTATFSARRISFSRFRTRAWRWSTASIPVCSGWKKIWALPLVATNDSHYLCEDDAHAQDVMVCIQTGKSIQDTNRMKFQGTGFFVKSHDEM